MTENNEIKQNEGNLKGYLYFWGGQLSSLLGSSVVHFVIIWHITLLTKRALYLSLAVFIGFIPMILITPLAGVFVDKIGRKKLLASVDFLQVLATVVLLFLFKINRASLFTIFIILAIRGVFQAFHNPAIHALIPIMVPKKHLSRINSLNFFLASIIQLIGPVVAALLYSLLPIHQILWIDAITFVIAFIPLIFITIPKIKRSSIQNEVEVKEKTSFRAELGEGFAFIKNTTGLLSLLILFSTVNFFIIPLFTLENLFVYVVHGGLEKQLAFVMAFFQAGTIASSLLLIFWKGFKRKINGIIIGLLILYIGYIITAATPIGLFWFMGVGMLLMGFSLPLANISSQTIWQTIVPQEKLGRVMSVRITIAQISTPVGMILAGILGELISIQILFIGAAVLGLGFVGYAWFFTKIRQIEGGPSYVEEKPKEVHVKLTETYKEMIKGEEKSETLLS